MKRVLFTLLFFVSINCVAQWTQTGGPFGCNNTYVTPYPGGIAAFSYNGIYLTTDTGSTWNEIAQFETKKIHSLITSNDTIYVFYENHLLMNEEHDSIFFTASFNAGQTWSFPIGFKKASRHFQKMSKSHNSILLNTDSLIYRSNDGGLNWTFSALPGNEYIQNLNLFDSYAIIDIESNWFLYNKYICDTILNFHQITSTRRLDQMLMIDSVLFTLNNNPNPKLINRSTDFGQTFSVVASDTDYIMRFMRMDSIIYYSNGNNFFASTDTGLTFNLSSYPREMAYDSWVKIADGREIYSQNGGDSEIGINDINPDTSYSIMNGMRGSNIVSIQSSGTNLFAMKNMSILKSSNQGNTWNNISHGYHSNRIAIKGDTIIHFDLSTIRRSFDGGLTFNEIIPNGIPLGGNNICFNGNILYCIYAEDLFKSFDFGLNWSLVPSPLVTTPCGQTTIELYSICENNGKIFATTRAGSVWSIAPNNIWNYLFCYTPNFTSNAFYPIIVSAEDKLIVSSDTTMFISLDNGTTWNPARMNGIPTTSNYPEKLIGSTIIGYGSDLYGISRLEGIYYSYNNGDDWTKFPSQYFPFMPSCLTICNNQLFAGSSEKSVWTTTTLLGVSQPSSDTDNFILFPNPAHDHFSIECKSSIYFTISVFDSFGNLKLKSLKEGKEQEISTENLSTGVYIVSMLDNVTQRNEIKKLIVLK